MAYPHWSLFETIDEDLEAFSRQVEFDKTNFRVYSVTLVRLYLSICSEVDVLAKLLCRRVGAVLPKTPNMDHYRKALLPKYQNLTSLKITVRPISYSILPWQAWDTNKNPDWWKKHQGVKHERNLHFPDANLENVLYAAAGLVVFLIYWHQPQIYNVVRSPFLHAELNPAFRMFDIDGIHRSLGMLPDCRLADFGERNI